MMLYRLVLYVYIVVELFIIKIMLTFPIYEASLIYLLLERNYITSTLYSQIGGYKLQFSKKLAGRRHFITYYSVNGFGSF
jgi:hypothetical protein